jgi:hypothetical protein
VDTSIINPSDIYVLNKMRKEICFLGREDESCHWNRRMVHINFDNIFKVNKREAIIEMHDISVGCGA